MKPLNIRPVKFKSKEDCHPKRIEKSYLKKDKLHNWWEECSFVGDGTLKQELKNEISLGIEEYKELKNEN